MVGRKPLKRLLNGKLRELIDLLEEDIRIFGRVRKHIVRGVFNIIDELLLDGHDVKVILDKLSGLSDDILLISDKIDYLTKLASSYAKIGYQDGFNVLINETESLVYSLWDNLERAKKLLVLIDASVRALRSEKYNKFIKELMNVTESLSDFNRVLIYSRLGVILSRVDTGRGDSLVNYGKDLINNIDLSELRARALFHVARSLVEVSRDGENLRLAKSWLSEGFRIADLMDVRDYISLISESIGDIYVVSKSKAAQLVSEIINQTRPNNEGFNILLKVLEKLNQVRAEELAEKVRRLIVFRLNKTSLLSQDEKLIYLARLANCDAMIDIYLANYMAKHIFNALSRILSHPNSIDLWSILEVIKWFSNLDLYNGYIFFTIAMKSKRGMDSSLSNIKKLMRIYNEFKFIFPKPILQRATEFYNLVINRDGDLIKGLPQILGIIIDLERNYEKYVREAIKKLMSINDPSIRISLLSRIANHLYRRDYAWATGLTEYCVDEAMSMSTVQAAKIILEVSENIYESNFIEAKRLLRTVITLLEENYEEEGVPELLTRVSIKMRKKFGDAGWARQIELLANEIKSKRSRFFKRQ